MPGRRRFSGDFKTKLVLEALRGDMTVQEIAFRHKVHPNQVSARKRQAIEGMSDVFSVKKENADIPRENEIHELHAKIGQLTVIRDWFSFYNTQRPYSALDSRTPKEVYENGNSLMGHAPSMKEHKTVA